MPRTVASPDDWLDFFPDDHPHRRVTKGNRVTHLIDDDRAVQAMWRIIDEAETQIWMSMYILKPDDIGLGTLARMAQAAQRGVEVRLIYDDLGSVGLRKKHLRPLLRAGGQATAFHPLWKPWRGRPHLRNHRKLLIVDGQAAVGGGLNLSESFAGTEMGEWEFDDTMLYLQGPAVCDVASVFRRTWNETTGTDCTLPKRMDPQEDGCPVEVLETDARRPETRLRELLSAAVSRTHHRCYLVTPYFIPAPWLMTGLLTAADRGADVRVMTAGASDVPAALIAGRHCYTELLERGARVFELQGRTLHSKTVTIDGRFNVVGSYNFDCWTVQHVLDTGLSVLDHDLAASLEHEFEDYMSDAREMTLDDQHARSPLARRRQHAFYRLARAMS